MKYAGIIKNDFAAAPGVSTTFFVQGCPHHCPECHNPETWDFKGGKEFTNDTLKEIDDALCANGLHRTFCVMGGEPMCEQNLLLTYLVINHVKQKYPNTKVYIWSGYYYEDLLKMSNPKVKMILDKADCLIDGPFILAEKDLTLPMRGSRNQNIIELTK